MTVTSRHMQHPVGASRRRRTALAGTAFAAAAGLALAGPIAAALAQVDGEPVVQSSETVKVELDSTGKLEVARLFSQIQASGKGDVSLEDPTSTSGVRNLDGWSAPSTSDGKATYDFSVDGTRNFRTVAKFTKDLPVTIAVEYTLDGKPITPGRLAGKTGTLEVTYHVANVTAAPIEITYLDGAGEDVTETIDLVTPFVGQLALDLPSSFKRIATNDNRADQAGNGHGGRLLAWTMVLFEPIGQVEQTFGFSAEVSDAAIPAAHVQLLPVTPERHPELKFGQDGFESGAATGRKLTAGATEIDANVLKLRDGAAQLLNGLTQLQDGAVQLNDGLANGVPQAIDGGQQLAAGAKKAADGGDQLAAGAKKVAKGNKDLAVGLGALADGAGQLQTGAKDLSAGASRLSTGFQDPESDSDLIDGSQALAGALGLISDGLGKLNDGTSGLPAARSGLVTLRAGIDHPVGAAGAADPGGLYQGLQQIAFGLSNPGCSLADPANTANPCGVKQGLAGLAFGVSNPGCSLADPSNAANPCGLKEGLAGVKVGLSNTACDTSNPTNPANPCGVRENIGLVQSALSAQLKAVAFNFYVANACLGSPSSVAPPPNPPTNTCEGLATLYYGTDSAATNLGNINTQGVDRLSGAVSLMLGKLAEAQTGLASIRAGVDRLATGSASARDGVRTQILPGIDQLLAGLGTAVSGIGQLAPGASAANVGAGDLALGIAQAGDGAQQLAAGAAQLSGGLDQVGEKVPAAVTGAQALATGSSALSDGSTELAAALSGQLAPGAQQLANGLSDLNAAVDGSAQISDGLGQASDGGTQLVDGAGRLSKEGTTQLIAAGDETSKEFGKEYAIMQALNDRGTANALPYGAPNGVEDARAAYDISIAPVGHIGGLGSVSRGVVGLVVLGLGAFGATALRGRFA